MGNRPTKQSKGPAYRYNIHGIQYLEERPTRADKRREAKSQNGCVRNTNGLTPAGGKEHNALYVSNDWTAKIYDTESVTDMDWTNASAYPYENIVMSGGGSKGYAFIGALKALEDAGVLQNIKRVAGSSAGAICAGLIAVGCTPQDLANVFKGDIKWLFQDQTCAGCCCIPKIFKTYGVHPGNRFYRIYGQHIANKTGNPDITFAEVQEKYGRELCIVVTNLSKMCSEYCTPQNTPDLPVRTAVRMSMSFPMVYQAVKCEINGETSLYTDGGTLDQYPVHCFDDKRLDLNHNIKRTSLKSEMNRKTVGIYVVSETAIDYKIWSALFGCKIPYKPTYFPDSKLSRTRLQEEFEKRKRKMKDFSMKDFLTELSAEENNHDEPIFHYETCNKSTVDIRNFKDYFVTTIETLLISQRKLRIKPHDAQRTVAVNCGYIGTNDYVIEPADREFMIRQGYEHTKQFLKEFIKKSCEIRLDASLTSQTIVEVSPSREVYHDDMPITRSHDTRGRRLPDDVLAVTSVNLTGTSLRYMDDTFGSIDNLDDVFDTNISQSESGLKNQKRDNRNSQPRTGNCNLQAPVDTASARNVVENTHACKPEVYNSSVGETIDSGYCDKNKDNGSQTSFKQSDQSNLTDDMCEHFSFLASPGNDCDSSLHKPIISPNTKQPIKTNNTSVHSRKPGKPTLYLDNLSSHNAPLVTSRDPHDPVASLDSRTREFMQPFPTFSVTKLSNQNTKYQITPSPQSPSDVTVRTHIMKVPRSISTASSVETAV